jgi:hypothetical protein
MIIPLWQWPHCGTWWAIQALWTLQPAEHLWQLVDEPLANTYFDAIEDLDKAVGERCVALMNQHDMVRASTLFHWWPR